MDGVDRRILHQLQRDATITNARLADLAGASASSVHRRIRKLHCDGVIESVVAIVDPGAAGRGLTLVVGLEIERKEPRMYDQLKQWLLTEDAVQQAYNVTGEHDFIVIVTARSVAEYDELMDRMLSANHNIRKYRTNVVLYPFKKSLFVPVLED